MTYIDIAEAAFWPDEYDADEYQRQREHEAARRREYEETGYWSEPSDMEG